MSLPRFTFNRRQHLILGSHIKTVVKSALAAGALVVLVAVTGFYSFVLIKPNAYPIPAANVTAVLPPGVSYKQLTTGTWDDFWPAWSPNGSLIAYVSYRTGEPALWIMSASGTGALQASAGSEAIGYPSWNPNSTMVAYWSMNGQDSEIDIYNVENNSTYVVPGSGPLAVQSAPAWSPDGSYLAFFVRSTESQLLVLDLGTGRTTAVANVSGSYLAASWATGDSLLYSSSTEGYEQIMRLTLSTDEESQLFNETANSISPTVGLSGQLAYYSDLNPGQDSDYLQGYGGFDVWVSNTDGTNATFQYSLVHETEGSGQIVEVPYIPGVIDTSVQPAWSYDGTMIVYRALLEGMGSSLYLWNVGSATTTEIGPMGPGVDSFEPSWSPSGASIAFCSDLGGLYHIWVTNTNGSAASTGNGGY